MNFIFRGFEVNPNGKEKIYINNEELIGNWREGYFTRYSRIAAVGIPTIQTEWDSYVVDERTICPCMEYCDDNGRLYGHMDIISCKYYSAKSVKEDRYLIQWIDEGQEYQISEINPDMPFYGRVDTYFHNFGEIAWKDVVVNILQDCYGSYTSKTIIGNAFSNPELLGKVEHI